MPRTHSHASVRASLRRGLSLISSFDEVSAARNRTIVALGADLNAKPYQVPARHPVFVHPTAYAEISRRWTVVNAEREVIPAGAFPLGIGAWFAHRV